MPRTKTNQLNNPAPVMYLVNPPPEGVKKLMAQTSARASGKTNGARAGTRSAAASKNPISAKEIVKAIQGTPAPPVAAPVVKAKKANRVQRNPRSNPIFPSASEAVNLLVKGGIAAFGAAATEFSSQLFLPKLDETKIGAVLKRLAVTFGIFWIAKQVSPFASEYLLIGGASNAAGVLVTPYAQQILTSTTDVFLPQTDDGLSGLYPASAINPASELNAADPGSGLQGFYPLANINPASELSNPDGAMY